MPEITAETPRETYTIAGKTFSLAQPFAEGHVLTSGQASALNQTFAENIRNNFASRVKELDETGTFDQDTAQLELDDYMNEYEFGVRRGGGGGRTGDPVRAEAMLIAKDKVRKALKKKGHNLKDVAASDITKLAKDVLDSGRYPEILAAAQARVAAQQDIADIELGGEPSAEESEASTSSKRRAAAE